ncbi:MAG: PTS sugar transporter subunit IIB [candidate division KSB1 bacterium]|nr:PTS sugar transporter subunit IIB [candidate division KSB1 bacterium]MDZ7317565.1 PTS sugar transporter subunit IIB [candidate division KSB1 bacterium]MDZ7340172.1 PTS sugar transporter subunit IIB [candidate division KSB1 bacterium]
MSLVLVRIDDRLIHGQVVAGWGMHLNPDRILLSSDTIANSPWEKEMYMAAEATAPYPVVISVMTQDETLAFLSDSAAAKEKIILLIETPQEILQLIRRGLKIQQLNVGGMHFKAGKRRLAPFIFVDDEDISCFREIHNRNIQIEGRDVPTAKALDIISMIDSEK